MVPCGNEKASPDKCPARRRLQPLGGGWSKFGLSALMKEPAKTADQKFGTIPVGPVDHVGDLVVGGQRAIWQRGYALDVSVIWHISNS